MLNKLSLAWPYPMCLVLTEYPSTSKHPTLYQSLFLAYRDNSFAILLINRNYNPTSNPITCLETYFTVKEDVLTLRDDETITCPVFTNIILKNSINESLLISFFDDIKIVFNKENFLHCYRLF
jgi:hypothetical protein